MPPRLRHGALQRSVSPPLTAVHTPAPGRPGVTLYRTPTSHVPTRRTACTTCCIGRPSTNSTAAVLVRSPGPHRARRMSGIDTSDLVAERRHLVHGR